MPRAHPPRPYDPEVAWEIVMRLQSGEMLRDLWRDPTLPGRYTLKRWRHEHRGFSRAVRAVVNQARSRRYRARSPYGWAVREAICDRIAEGESLKAILRDPGMPNRNVVGHWLNTEPEFRRTMAIARDMANWLQYDAGRGGMDGRVHGQKHTLEQIRWEEQQARRAAASFPAPAGEGDRPPKPAQAG